MAITPWPDQELFIADIRNAMRRVRRVLGVAPTGFGKTICFVLLALMVAERRKRVVIVAHRIEIVNQISRALERAGVMHDVMAPGRRQYGARVVVAMVQSVGRRAATMPKPDLLIVDEAHHATAGSYKALTQQWPDVFVLGVTASPQRTDGSGLGECFDEMVIGPTMRELIARGRLADFTYLAPTQKADLSSVKTRAGDYALDQLAAAMDHSTVTGDAIQTYAKHLNGAPAIAFCVSVAHADHVAEQFVAAGWRAASVDGSTVERVRADRIAAIGDGRLNILASCDIISEGTDIPAVAGAILLRPTKSLIIYLQQCGRVLRVKADGSKAVILDHVGSVFNFGLPDEIREWSLAGHQKRAPAVSVRQCEKCYAAFRPQPKCPACGHVLAVAKKAPRAIQQQDGELSEVDAEKVRQIREANLKDLLRGAKTRDALEQIAKVRGYDKRWVSHILAARGQRESRAA